MVSIYAAAAKGGGEAIFLVSCRTTETCASRRKPRRRDRRPCLILPTPRANGSGLAQSRTWRRPSSRTCATSSAVEAVQQQRNHQRRPCPKPARRLIPSMCLKSPYTTLVPESAEKHGGPAAPTPYEELPHSAGLTLSFLLSILSPVLFGNADSGTRRVTMTFAPPAPASIGIAFLQPLSKEVRGPSWWSRCRTS